MIEYLKGNLLESKADALVNTVNTVGVMGKGIALQFKERFPENFKAYHKSVEEKKIEIGKMFVTHANETDGARWIINFPTKKHWLHPSKLEFISAGLDDLTRIIAEKKIRSIAIPPLGCGNGGLNWKDVKQLMEEKLKAVEGVAVYIYEPSEIAYTRPLKETKKKEPALTAIRAMVLSLMKDYASVGYTMTLLETQKLVYFLQRSGEVLRLDFMKHEYGPYSPKLNHVLYDLDGFYIHGMKYKEVKKFDPLIVDKSKTEKVDLTLSELTNEQQKTRLSMVAGLIEGFEFPFGMELLSSVDFVMKYESTNYADLKEVILKVHQWNERKRKQFY